MLSLALLFAMFTLQAQDTSSYWKDSIPIAVELKLSLVMKRGLLEELGQIADTAIIEHSVCGVGKIIGYVAHVDLLYTPIVHEATNEYIYAEGCPIAALLQWHNHPPDIPLTKTLISYCYLSKLDIDEALERSQAFVQMVHVRKWVYCWWERQQIRDFSEKYPLAEKMYPIRGQSSWTLK